LGHHDIPYLHEDSASQSKLETEETYKTKRSSYYKEKQEFWKNRTETEKKKKRASKALSK